MYTSSTFAESSAGNIVRALRASFHMNSYELAKKSGLNATTLYTLENWLYIGNYKIPDSVLIHLSNGLGIKLEEITSILTYSKLNPSYLQALRLCIENINHDKMSETVTRGGILRIIRICLEMDLISYSKKLNLSSSSIRNYEMNKTKISKKSALKYSIFLKITIEEFYSLLEYADTKPTYCEALSKVLEVVFEI